MERAIDIGQVRHYDARRVKTMATNRITPFELARILRRDMSTINGAIRYAEHIGQAGGAYATDYTEAAEYLRRMYHTEEVDSQ